MLRLGLVAALVCLLAPAVSRAEGLSGPWLLPVGKVQVSETADGVVGKLEDPDKGCAALTKGAEVLHGTFVDGAFTGELRVCLEGPDCRAKESWLSALLMADPSAQKLSGAIERGNEACHARLPGKGGVVLRRWSAHAPRVDVRAKISPDKLERAQALIATGGEYLQAGEAEQARDKFNQAIAIAPLAEAYNGVGVTHYLRNEYPEALASYKQAIAADPDFGDAYYNAACIYALTGKKALAFKALEVSAKNRFHDFGQLDDDQDLRSLHDDPRWKSLEKLAHEQSAK